MDRQAVEKQLHTKFDMLCSALDSPEGLMDMKWLILCLARCFVAGFSSRIALATVIAALQDRWLQGPWPEAEGVAENALRNRMCLRDAIQPFLQTIMDITAEKLSETNDGCNLLAELEILTSHPANAAAMASDSDDSDLP